MEKSEWLSVLVTKKYWDDIFSSVSLACVILLILTKGQSTLPCSIASSKKFQPNLEVPVLPVNKSSDFKTASNKSPPQSNQISSSKINPPPLKLNVKTNCQMKNQSKKLTELEKAKQSKSTKRDQNNLFPEKIF